MVTRNTIEDVREDMMRQFMAEPPSPSNTLTKDFLLATINYAEKVMDDPKETLGHHINDIANAAASSMCNMIFRLYGLEIRDTERFVAAIKYGQKAYHEYFSKFAAEMVVINMTEDNKKGDQEAT